MTFDLFDIQGRNVMSSLYLKVPGVFNNGPKKDFVGIGYFLANELVDGALLA